MTTFQGWLKHRIKIAKTEGEKLVLGQALQVYDKEKIGFNQKIDVFTVYQTVRALEPYLKKGWAKKILENEGGIWNTKQKRTMSGKRKPKK